MNLLWRFYLTLLEEGGNLEFSIMGIVKMNPEVPTVWGEEAKSQKNDYPALGSEVSVVEV